MNYAALKCAMHDERYSDFCKILQKMGRFSHEEDEIFVHACFFGKLSYIRQLLKSNILQNPVATFTASIGICLKRRLYKVIDILFENTGIYFTPYEFEQLIWLRLLNYFTEYSHDYIGFEYCYNNIIKKMCDADISFYYPIMCSTVKNLIARLKVIMNNTCKNKYLLLEIIQRHPISQNFTAYQLFNMI